MLASVVVQVISTLAHRALRGPVSRKRVAHGRTVNRVGTTTTTSMTLRAMGALRAMSTLRAMSALRAAGMRTLGTLRAMGSLGTCRGCHIYLATGNSIRGSRMTHAYKNHRRRPLFFRLSPIAISFRCHISVSYLIS